MVCTKGRLVVQNKLCTTSPAAWEIQLAAAERDGHVPMSELEPLGHGLVLEVCLFLRGENRRDGARTREEQRRTIPPWLRRFAGHPEIQLLTDAQVQQVIEIQRVVVEGELLPDKDIDVRNRRQWESASTLRLSPCGKDAVERLKQHGLAHARSTHDAHKCPLSERG